MTKKKYFLKMEENFYKSLNLKTKYNLIVSNEINGNFNKLLQKDIIITNDLKLWVMNYLLLKKK